MNEGFANRNKQSSALLSVWDLPYGLIKALSEARCWLGAGEWCAVPRNGAACICLSGVSNPANSICSGDVGVIVAITC